MCCCRSGSHRSIKEHGNNVEIVFHAIIEQSIAKAIGYNGIYLQFHTAAFNNTQQTMYQPKKMGEQ